MRGAREPLLLTPSFSGIIPADAGSTPNERDSGGGNRDHPRGCGEHLTAYPVDAFHAGSSPRMRGARPSRKTTVSPRRIIPADAGSTPVCKAPLRHSADHPRGCGEHSCKAKRKSTDGGSSPRMRGAQTDGSCRAPAGGIIPADAGSTPMFRATYFPV